MFMTFTENEAKVVSLQLTKESQPDQVRTYFQKILELKKTGKEFPINLDDVWPLVYPRKDHAVRVLNADFIESVDFQVFPKNGEQKSGKVGGRKTVDYLLSIECVEYFIAKKVKPVFEVYRKVFHATIENGQQQPQLGESASAFQENTVITVKMGQNINQVYVTEGIIYAKFSPIMKYLGYMSGSNKQYIQRIGSQYFKLVAVGLQESWFINIDGFDKLLQMTTLNIPSSVLSSIYRDVFGVEKPEKESPFNYRFTDGEMLEIITEVNRKPINKEKVLWFLLNGKK